MSLIRQIRLLLLGVVLLAIAGGATVNLLSARDALQTQLRLKNSDNAQSLALALSQQHGEAQLMELLMAAQFDTGFYRRVKLVRPDGAVAFERSGPSTPTAAPDWFANLLAIESEPGIAQVSDGWRALGHLEVVSHVSYAYDDLWHGGLRAAGFEWEVSQFRRSGVACTGTEFCNLAITETKHRLREIVNDIRNGVSKCSADWPVHHTGMRMAKPFSTWAKPMVTTANRFSDDQVLAMR